MDTFKKLENIQNGIISAEHKIFSGTVSPHRHEFFEIEYIINGCGDYIINGNVYPIEQNMLFFMTPADFHSVNATDAEMINVMFPCEYTDIDSLFRLVMQSNMQSIRLNESDSILINAMLREVILSSSQCNYSYALRFLSCVLSKLVSLSGSRSDKTPSHIQKVIIYILENFRSGVTLEQAASHTGLSPAYLSSLFCSNMGITFKNYLDNIRFDYSARLLSFSDMTVLEVCFSSGFNDYANFTRRFKKRFGLTPNNYRAVHFRI